MQLAYAVVKALLELHYSQYKSRYKECLRLVFEPGLLSKNAYCTVHNRRGLPIEWSVQVGQFTIKRGC